MPQTAEPDLPRFSIRGIDIAAIDISRARDFLRTLIARKPGAYLTVTGAHGIVESAYDTAVMRAHQEAAAAFPDGMPLVWLGRLIGFRSMSRVYGPDLMTAVFSVKELRQLGHFFYGGSPTAISKLRERLVLRFGDFNMVGMHCPPMLPVGFVEEEETIRRIRQLAPEFIWVGLSTPKQEVWLNMHMPRIGRGLGIGVGAAFDLLSGSVRQAPYWVQHSGFEWLFRLMMEPRRLARRYLFVIPIFAAFWIEALFMEWRKVPGLTGRHKTIQ
jgi:N-acetylglucosaminyldiphosphoundecaprenol N-acetyl-beta-D-mannosaminyltransferase